MNLDIESGGSLEVSEVAFAREFNEALVFQVVQSYLASGRQGTKAQKTRSQVRGGGRKPWRQKGTGRARAGTTRSPIWRSGGKVFAADGQQNFKQKVNRKMYRGAMQCIFSELARQDRLVVTDSFDIAEPKTKLLVERLRSMNIDKALIVTDSDEMNLFLSARNIAKVDVVNSAQIDPVSLISYPKVIATVGAIKKIEQQLTPEVAKNAEA